MWVDPAIRGSGAADDLVAAVIGWAASEHASIVRPDVVQHNTRARHFYERLGFRETGHTTVTSATAASGSGWSARSTSRWVGDPCASFPTAWTG